MSLSLDRRFPSSGSGFLIRVTPASVYTQAEVRKVSSCGQDGDGSSL